MTPADVIEELTAAAEQELLEVRASEAARRIPVHNGHCAGQAGTDWLYTFGLQYPVTLPDDVPLRIELQSDESYTGQLVSATAFEITLACGVRLPEKLHTASITLNSSFILEQLLLRLSELEPEACDLPMALFGFRQPRRSEDTSPLDDPDANEFQIEALRAVLERDVTYVWGPPGTGKTTALALIAAALVSSGLRVLAVASTNIAVDNAVIKVAERVTGDAAVVRVGMPRLPALREPLLAPAHRRGSLMQTMPLPFDSPSAMAPAVRAEVGDRAVVVLPAKRLPDGKDEAARQRTLRQARVVGATLSRVALTPELATPGFDVVLLDEASAAQLPAVFAAAALARAKVVALGDPKQLPPVAQSNGPLSRRWLQRDVFAQAGLDDDDPRAVLLREQYRMHPEISRLSNRLVYANRLRDAPRLRLASGGAYLVDTSATSPRCERQDGSRMNRVHAEAAVSVAAKILSQGGFRPRLAGQPDTSWLDALIRDAEAAEDEPQELIRILTAVVAELASRRMSGRYQVINLRAQVQLSRAPINIGAQLRALAIHPVNAPAVKSPSVAVITPYRAQSRLIWRLLRDARLDKAVEVGTVHQFQGLERGAIVFDTVEAPPERPAPFVSGGYGSEAMRLINVAITRAQAELVVIANVEHLARTLRRDSTLRGLLELLAGE